MQSSRIIISISLLCSTVMLRAQTPSQPASVSAVPKFDVISIKPDKTNGNMIRSSFTPDGISVVNAPLHMLLTQAYGLNDNQLVNEPDWSRTAHFDIEAKVAASDAPVLKTLSFDQRKGMAQQVLTERFGLVVHHETRELPEFALTVAKGGPKLAVAKPDPEHPMRPGSPGNFRMSMDPAGRKIEAASATLQALLQILSNETGRTVVDKTGLSGHYDFTLTWTPDLAGQPGERPPAPNSDGQSSEIGPTLFTALQEQLGLRLEPIRGPVDVLVIDHVELPSAN